jgi:urease accessory protein
MKCFSRCLKFLLMSLPALFALALPSLVYAHVGVDSASGWVHGFAHPLGGADHVLAMIAVGLWAAQMGGRAVWLVPFTFVTVMALGGLMRPTVWTA